MIQDMNRNKCKPIGVFDSGLGGLSVLKTLITMMPNESFIYFGDSLRAPYGPKLPETILNYSQEIVEDFISRGVKAVVIACNTATSAAAHVLREKYSIPIIGMEPALKPAAMAHPGGRIAVLATEMTLREQKFARLMTRHQGNVTLAKMAVPEFVTLVDQGIVAGPQIDAVLERLFPKDESLPIDGLVLGCTHYVFLRQAISDYFSYPVNIYDGNLGTARHLKEVLEGSQLLCDGNEKGTITLLNSAGADMVQRSYRLLDLEKR